MKTILVIVALVLVGRMVHTSKSAQVESSYVPPQETAVVFDVPSGMISAHKSETTRVKSTPKAKSAPKELQMKCGAWTGLATDATQQVKRCEYL